MENLRKVYDTGAVQVSALEGIELTIDPGEFLSIMGLRDPANPLL